VSGSDRDRRRGFTLVELLAVVFIVSIIALAMIPALDNMVPSYRLRSGARNVGSMIELGQSEAIANRKEFAIAYDLDENTYWLILPPAPPPGAEEQAETPPGEMDPKMSGKRPVDDVEHGLPPPDPQATQEQGTVADLPGFEEREYLEPERLPDGVEFERVIVGDEEKTTGRVYVPFTHLGQSGAHVVGFKLSEQDAQEEVWLKFQPLSRTLELSAERPEVRTLQSEGGGGDQPATPPMAPGG
jgi:prepilin-type N-terminal cleavage/methylation domain-containing protein